MIAKYPVVWLARKYFIKVQNMLNLLYQLESTPQNKTLCLGEVRNGTKSIKLTRGKNMDFITINVHAKLVK